MINKSEDPFSTSKNEVVEKPTVDTVKKTYNDLMEPFRELEGRFGKPISGSTGELKEAFASVKTGIQQITDRIGNISEDDVPSTAKKLAELHDAINALNRTMETNSRESFL